MSKMIRQFLSIVLVLVLVVNILPLNAFASDEMDVGDAAQDNTSNDISSIGTASESNALEVYTEAAEVVEEDLSKRGEFYKEFLLSNGMRLAAIYPTSIHYEEDGQWKEIDNTLTAMVVNGQPAYSNTAGLWQVRFPQQLTGSNAISITKNGYTLSFGMAGEIRSAGDLAVASMGLTAEANLSNSFTLRTAEASVAQIQQMDIDSIKAATEFEETVPDKLYSKLMYPTVYENTNVIYDLCGNQLKESIVLQAYDAALRGYRYELNTGGLVPVLNDDRSIHLCDPVTNDIVMSMPAPFMLDANQEFCDDVEVTLIQNGDTYLLSYHLPTQWLAEAERAWPVVLDPVVNANNDRTNIQDITVAQV